MARCASPPRLRLLEEILGGLARVNRYEERFIAKTGLDVFNRLSNDVLDATENQYFFIAFIVADHAHAVISNIIDALAIDRVLNVEPHLLVEKE